MSISPFSNKRSFVEMFRRSAMGAKNNEDPWKALLCGVRGCIGHDGVERISTNDVFDLLEVPVKRRPSLTVRLSRIMRSLEWSNIRARGLNPGSYRDRVRGFAREIHPHPSMGRQVNLGRGEDHD